MSQKDKKKLKSKYIHNPRLKPYTVKQEMDVFLGDLLHWIFILSFPITIFFALATSKKIYFSLLLCGCTFLLYAVYYLAGVIFKWDHTRICVKKLMKIHKVDIRKDWSYQDTKDIIKFIVLDFVLGLVLIVGFTQGF